MELERLINRHKDSVYRQMVRVCGNHADAEDALGDAILAAIRAYDQLREPEAFRGWLARIGTRSCARMRIRSRITETVSLSDLALKGIELSDDGNDPMVEAEMEMMRTCVSTALDTLPPIYREVYLRRDILGHKAVEVVRDLGISLPAVKSRLHRAREMVRLAIDEGTGCRELSQAAPF
ncbi:MAG: RNA polymerase sigma factor [Armatimonadetes bacterium]|nr:RNA polymerase sigma factor [Armatimonadota bacterium]